VGGASDGRLIAVARHAHSQLNLERRVNGDPAVPVALTETGVEEAGRLGLQLACLPVELGVHTRFDRTRRTLALALDGRDVPLREEPLLDDVDVGELEGVSLDEYRAWKEEHTRADRFPAGESLDESALRYAAGFRALLARPERTILVVCHEIPLRYALNAARGSDDLDRPVHAIPNATPYLFDGGALARAAARIEELSSRGRSGAAR
jgi:broad specificity phosphatase PhoE